MNYGTNFINSELLERIIHNTVHSTMKRYRFCVDPIEANRYTEKALRNAKRTIKRYEGKLWEGY